MGYPRIHFAGKVYADANYANNEMCFYRPDVETVKSYDYHELYVKYGTNEFYFYDCHVTSVVYEDGTFSTDDPIVGHEIIGNLDRPQPKMVDNSLSSFTAIFGMSFGIKWTEKAPKNRYDIAFYGKWSVNVVTTFQWPSGKCYSRTHHGDGPPESDKEFSALSTTKIINVNWGNVGGSDALKQLQSRAATSGSEELAVRITMFLHSQSTGIITVAGVIGVPSPTDTLGFAGERAMYPANDPLGITINSNDTCYNMNLTEFEKWTQLAPFELDRERNELRVDLSNSLPNDIERRTIRDLGVLRFGILTPSDCVYLLGEEEGLSYNDTEEYLLTSAIYAIPLSNPLVDRAANSPIVLVQVMETDEGTSISCKTYGTPGQQNIHIILQERPYYVRPKGLTISYLDRQGNPDGSQVIYVTKYGTPAQGVKVTPVLYEEWGPSIPADGLIPIPSQAVTDERGLATFVFKMNEEITIPAERQFKESPCIKFVPSDTKTTVAVDSAVYMYYYCIDDPETPCDSEEISTLKILSSFLVFSDEVNYTRPYTWVEDVGPILESFARVAPVMTKVFDISDYNTVTLPHNINLLRKSLRVGIEDPSHMPVTRDLNPVKRAMILEWLDNPKYDLLDTKVPSLEEHPVCPSCMVNITTPLSPTNDTHPPRCVLTSLDFQAPPHHYDTYFNQILMDTGLSQSQSLVQTKRPLFTSGTCNLRNLKHQLQTAIELEWTTLPVYLTSLYSIKEGYNPQIAYIIRSIAEQEMVHMMQAANILIALNGSPLIDHATMAPTFPITGLPGGVLPSLGVTIGKMSLEHVYKVFMGIEVPQNSFVGAYPIINNETTVGAFYDEIKRCINLLGDRIFNPFSVARQVEWPGAKTKDVGTIVKITDSASAKRAIDLITSQGEGAGILNPEDLQSNNLAHFFRFEEIVCQRRLVKVSNLNYAYAGAPILFDANGVWNMRPNPSAATTPPDSNCYDGSLFFHQIYRNLLRSLQELFNGRPKQSFVTVQLMESLLVHAKRLMLTQAKAYPGDTTTCGPVWDYYWPQA